MGVWKRSGATTQPCLTPLPIGTKCRRNIAENVNRLSTVHERYRQTDDRQTDGR